MELEECWTETELSDMGGETHRLGELLNGAVNLLFLLRDAACVLTQAYLDALSRWVEQNPQEDRRIRVVVNSAPKGAAASLRGRKYPFTILCDETGDCCERFGAGTASDLASLGDERTKMRIEAAYKAGFQHGSDTGNSLRLPALLIFDCGRRLLYAHYGARADDLPDVWDALRLSQGEVGLSCGAQLISREAE